MCYTSVGHMVIHDIARKRTVGRWAMGTAASRRLTQSSSDLQWSCPAPSQFDYVDRTPGTWKEYKPAIQRQVGGARFLTPNVLAGTSTQAHLMMTMPLHVGLELRRLGSIHLIEFSVGYPSLLFCAGINITCIVAGVNRQLRTGYLTRCKASQLGSRNLIFILTGELMQAQSSMHTEARPRTRHTLLIRQALRC